MFYVLVDCLNCPDKTTSWLFAGNGGAEKKMEAAILLKILSRLL